MILIRLLDIRDIEKIIGFSIIKHLRTEIISNFKHCNRIVKNVFNQIIKQTFKLRPYRFVSLTKAFCGDGWEWSGKERTHHLARPPGLFVIARSAEFTNLFTIHFCLTVCAFFIMLKRLHLFCVRSPLRILKFIYGIFPNASRESRSIIVFTQPYCRPT